MASISSSMVSTAAGAGCETPKLDCPVASMDCFTVEMEMAPPVIDSEKVARLSTKALYAISAAAAGERGMSAILSALEREDKKFFHDFRRGKAHLTTQQLEELLATELAAIKNNKRTIANGLLFLSKLGPISEEFFIVARDYAKKIRDPLVSEIISRFSLIR